MSRVGPLIARGLLLTGLCLVPAAVSAQDAAPTDDDPRRELSAAERAVLAADRPTVRVNRVPRPPRLDEFLEMRPPEDLAGAMTMVTGFVQQNPEDGNPASQRTHVWLGYDDRNFYCVFVAFDDQPERVRARLSRREQPFGDETVEIMLDSFHDQRRAFAFLTNPFGIQWDALWTEGGSGGNFDSAWDTVWQSDGALTDQGYVVVMSIPFKSLRFDSRSAPGAEQTWGFILVRDIVRNNETSFWPRVSNRVEGRLNQEATLNGLSDISPGRNVWLIPYVAARTYKLLDENLGLYERDHEFEAGLDAKFVFRDKLTLDLTANPNFAQVESDVPQITVNRRFEVLFPERRPFFLENKDFFSTDFNLVNTRRIRDPSGGARLTGKLGPWRVGTLVIDDEAPGDLAPPWTDASGDRAWNGIFSFSRDVGNQSNVGVLYTQRDFDDDSNKVASVNGRIKLGTNWEGRFQAVHSDTVVHARPDGREEDPDTERRTFADQAYSLIFNRAGRTHSAHLHYEEVGPDFFTALGFVPRNDVRNAHMSYDYNFRPERTLVRWGPSVNAGRIIDFDGTRLDKHAGAGLSFEWRGQTRLGFSYTDSRELLRTSDFAALMQNTDYDTSGYGISFGSEWFKSWQLDGGLSRGRGINFVPASGPPVPADRLNANVGLTLRLGRRTRIDGTALLAALDDRDTGARIFTNQIYRARLNWQWDPKLSLRVIVQYDETEVDPLLTDLEAVEGWNADFLFTYLVNPWTAFYAGYNTNYRNLALTPLGTGNPGNVVGLTANDYLNDSAQVFFKVSYLFRP